MVNTLQQTTNNSIQHLAPVQLALRLRASVLASHDQSETSAEEKPAEYYNPYTYRHETEEQLWASCGNWDM